MSVIRHEFLVLALLISLFHSELTSELKELSFMQLAHFGHSQLIIRPATVLKED